MANEDGVWRTVGGRRIFIKTGQSLSDAMKSSGKFKTGNKKKVDKNDLNALNKIADNNENIDNYEGLDDIAKDYIKNRRKEIGQKEFTDKANEINEKTRERAIESEKTTDSDKRYNTQSYIEAKARVDKEVRESGELGEDEYARKVVEEYANIENRSLQDADMKKATNQIKEDLKGANREEQKKINEDYIKEQSKLANEKESRQELTKEYKKYSDSTGSMSDDAFTEKARALGMSDEEIAKQIYAKHDGPESNTSSDNNIKRLLAKQKKEEALAKGDKTTADRFERYEKEFEGRTKQAVDDNNYHTDPELRKKDYENDMRFYEEMEKKYPTKSGLKANEEYQELKKAYESEFGKSTSKTNGATTKQVKNYDRQALSLSSGNGVNESLSNLASNESDGHRGAEEHVKNLVKANNSSPEAIAKALNDDKRVFNSNWKVEKVEDNVTKKNYNPYTNRTSEENYDKQYTLTSTDKLGNKSILKVYAGSSESGKTSNDWVRNAFNQYKKDHPGTRMTLADFKKNNKK